MKFLFLTLACKAINEFCFPKTIWDSRIHRKLLWIHKSPATKKAAWSSRGDFSSDYDNFPPDLQAPAKSWSKSSKWTSIGMIPWATAINIFLSSSCNNPDDESNNELFDSVVFIWSWVIRFLNSTRIILLFELSFYRAVFNLNFQIKSSNHVTRFLFEDK